MVLKIKALLFCLLFGLVFEAKGEIAKVLINQNKSSVQFMAIGNPSALKIKGEKAKVEGEVISSLNAFGAKLKVDLNEFVTGIETRDEHMKEKYLESKIPTNRYAVIDIANLPIPEVYWKNGENFKSTFKGILYLHNTQKEIVGDILFSPYKKGEEVATSSHFSLKLSDFNIKIPSFAGISVADTVNVEINLPLIVTEK